MSGRGRETTHYVIGYVSALVLTGAAFAAVRWPGLPSRELFGLVLALALVQMVVHVHYFLHVDLKKSSRHDLQLILFSTLIIALMVSGTLVILFNLRQRMM